LRFVRYSTFVIVIQNDRDMDSRLAIDTSGLSSVFIVIIFIGLYMGRRRRAIVTRSGSRNPVVGRASPIIAAERARNFVRTPGEDFHDRNYTYLHWRSAHSGAHPGQLHFHQALLRLQSLFDLRVSYRCVLVCRRRTRVSCFLSRACWRPVRASM